MKNYKYLIWIAMIAVFFISMYTLYINNMEIETTYNSYLTTARDYRSQKILIDAENNYMEALSVKPSIELYIEIGEMYVELGEQRKAEKWGEDILELFPKAADAYEYMIDVYIAEASFGSCFDLYERMLKRGVTSETVSKVIAGIEYTYFLQGKYDDVGMWTGSYCPVARKGQWSYIDVSGTLMSEYIFTRVGAFVSGIAPVITADGEAYFIDTEANKRKLVADIGNIEDVGMLVNGIYSLYDGNEWSFYDQENKFLFGGYTKASSMVNGIAAVENNNRWMLIDSTGANLTGKTYNDIIIDERAVAYNNGRAFVYQDSAYRMIDSTGAVIGTLAYDDAKPFYGASYAAVKIDSRWGFVDSNGELKIPVQYEDARSFSNGYAAVRIDGKWGFIDCEGNVLIEPTFDDARDFNSNGAALVYVEGNWKLLRLYKDNH